MKVVVLGAGLAGLSAAWRLSERGVEVELLETKPYVGGLARTIHRDGFIFDYGPHRFHTANPAILTEARKFVGDELEGRARKTRVYFLKKYFDYPLSAGNLFSSLPPSLAISSFVDFFTTWVRNKLSPRQDDNFEAWVINRFGRRLYDVYFGPYTAKVWGRDPRRLSASWAAQRVAVVDLWDLVQRTFGLKRGANDFHHSPYVLDFYYPRSGIGTLSERLAERIVANGGAVHLNSTVLAINHVGGRASAVTYTKDGALCTAQCDYLVSSLPITKLVKVLRPLPQSEVLAATEALQYRALIFLFLMLDKDKVSDDNWIYFPDPNVCFNRISEMKNFTPDAAPPGKTSLTIEISCDVGDELWTASEEDLYRRSVDALIDARLIRREQVLGHFFDRTAFAYPNYDVNFEVNLATLAYHLAGYDNLVTCGRQGLFRYLNMDHSMEMGLCAADEVLSQEIGSKVSRVGSEPVYFG
ncbi:MAG: FAD-dependent oxidoreductase [Chloroflexi bacterium]|nr:FAD-dependent oxidoreductase [Chloroflexota bacterium]